MIWVGQAAFWASISVAILKNLFQGWKGRGQSGSPGAAADVQRYVIYGLYLAVWWIALRESHATSPTVVCVGALAVIAGSGIALLAMRALGEDYRERIEPGQDSVLQTAGVFGWVRHPMRVGLVIELIGAAALSLDGVAAALTALVCILLVERSQKEEALLVARFGDDYVRYRETTPALPWGRFVKGRLSGST